MVDKDQTVLSSRGKAFGCAPKCRGCCCGETHYNAGPIGGGVRCAWRRTTWRAHSVSVPPTVSDPWIA